jgi:pilus assembly protein CpaF
MPPLAVDGTTVSIRKFTKEDFTLTKMIKNGTLSEQIARFLEVVTESRLNVLISGGTGSGKTTLLNAMSRLVGARERIITIEDSAELRLQQPHVVRLESRPPNIEGVGEVTIRDLVRNSLRMRPDRIIVGEVRGDETIDMLQAMNTGHDGSMSTIHANRPREALTRLENMMSMSGFEMPTRVVRNQIVGALTLVIHTERMRDGVRRVTQISEITGIEGDTIMTQDIFNFEYREEVFDTEKGETRIEGDFKQTGVMPQFLNRARLFGLDTKLKQIMRGKL